MLKLFATVSLVILSLFSVMAINYMGIDVSVDDKSYIKFTIISPEEKFEFEPSFNVQNFSSNVPCSIGHIISCNTSGVQRVEIQFSSDELITKAYKSNKFLLELAVLSNINSSTVLIKLPVGAVLEKEGEIYPKNSKLVTDGEHIMVYWEMEGVKRDQPLRFSLAYSLTGDQKSIKYIGLISSTALAIVIVVSITVIYRWRKARGEIILEVLDENERKVFEMVKQAGQINQKKVVQALNLSKAKVSRIVKKLVEKGLLESERRGRTNILKIRKKFLKKE